MVKKGGRERTGGSERSGSHLDFFAIEMDENETIQSEGIYRKMKPED